MAIYIGNAENEVMKVCGAASIGPKGDKGDKGDTGPAGTTDYNNLINKPDLTSYATKMYAEQAAYQEAETVKNSLASVARTGSYNDLTNKPTIPSLTGYATEQWVEGKGYLTKNAVESVNGETPDETGNIDIDASDIDLEATSTLSSTNVQSAIDELDEKVNAKQDALTAGANITIENNVISASGSSGTTNHNELTNRDAAGQHPISAITGLQTALDGLLPMSAGADHPITGDLFLAVGSSKRIRRLGTPQTEYDAANKKYVDNAISEAIGDIETALASV